jgi:hypothetical protein
LLGESRHRPAQKRYASFSGDVTDENDLQELIALLIHRENLVQAAQYAGATGGDMVEGKPQRLIATLTREASRLFPDA